MALAQKGATVIVAGRDEERCQNTVAHIQRETRNFHVDYLVGDLSNQFQVRQLAENFKTRSIFRTTTINSVGT